MHESGPDAMTVTWVSLDPYTPESSGSVSWGRVGGPTRNAPCLSIHSYTAGPFGWNGTIFWAVMNALEVGARHTYTVTSNGASSQPRQFTAAPAPNASAAVKLGVLADMGTIELAGWTVAAEVIREHAAAPFDLLFIAGDLAYATVDPPKNELQHLWDLWGLQNENFSSTAPWMMTVGNHESTPGSLINSSGTFSQEFAAFSTRWRMPGYGGSSQGYGNFYYSYAYGPAAWVSMNTEFPYAEGSEQWQWIEAALAAVDRTLYPWLFLSLHRPIYSVDNDEVPSHIPGGALSVALEPLLKKYRVDVVWQGHEHTAERTAAVFNGSVLGLPDASGVYSAPPAPIYIVQGTSGADLDIDHWISPIPAWNLVRQSCAF